MKQATARIAANWRRAYAMPVSNVYPSYIAKAEKKGRTRAEVDEIFCWLTGHSQASRGAEFAKKTSFEDFFAHAPKMNPSRFQITGVVCGVRVEEIQGPMMREIRYLDKLIDELAKGDKKDSPQIAARRIGQRICTRSSAAFAITGAVGMWHSGGSNGASRRTADALRQKRNCMLRASR